MIIYYMIDGSLLERMQPSILTILILRVVNKGLLAKKRRFCRLEGSAT